MCPCVIMCVSVRMCGIEPRMFVVLSVCACAGWVHCPDWLWHDTVWCWGRYDADAAAEAADKVAKDAPSLLADDDSLIF